MSTKQKALASAALILALSACASSELRTYASIDRTDKSMTVPPGGSGLVGSLKDALKTNGWHLSVDRGPDIMIISERWLDVCLPNLQDMLRYDISIVDNDAGSEVFTLSGRDCEDAIVEQFVAALDQ
jgi:hypothetical protein